MNLQTAVIAVPAVMPCPICKANTAVSAFLREKAILIGVYECECGAITIIPDAPNVIHAALVDPKTNAQRNILVLEQKVPKIATPHGFVRKAEGSAQ